MGLDVQLHNITIPICSPQKVGDGYCDDGNNNAPCSYDEGDCCPGDDSPSDWDRYCSICECKDGGLVSTTTTTIKKCPKPSKFNENLKNFQDISINILEMFDVCCADGDGFDRRDDCEDKGSRKDCKKLKKQDKCNTKKGMKKCKKTCGHCNCNKDNCSKCSFTRFLRRALEDIWIPAGWFTPTAVTFKPIPFDLII